MGLTFKKLHPHFVGEASPIELRRVHDPETLAAIRAGMDEYAVCVFRDQPFTDDEILKSDDRRRAYSLGNRLWHTDASFQDPPGRYSMLHAKVFLHAAAAT